jgi:hypothetical protein
MLTTINDVKLYTGYDVTNALISRAQAIIEIFIGRDEIDVQDVSDLVILNKMTAYQTAYMLENEDIVFKQVALSSQSQTDSNVTYDKSMNAPYIAPLAVLAAAGLSFNKSRSYKTGRIFQFGPKDRASLWRNN